MSSGRSSRTLTAAAAFLLVACGPPAGTMPDERLGGPEPAVAVGGSPEPDLAAPGGSATAPATAALPVSGRATGVLPVAPSVEADASALPRNRRGGEAGPGARGPIDAQGRFQNHASPTYVVPVP